ncbi:hypothetical protein TIFTF001_052267, partial [Ficus carica]
MALVEARRRMDAWWNVPHQILHGLRALTRGRRCAGWSEFRLLEIWVASEVDRMVGNASGAHVARVVE